MGVWDKDAVKELCDMLETPEIFEVRSLCAGRRSHAPHACLLRAHARTRALSLRSQALQGCEVVPEEGECLIGKIAKEDLWEARRQAAARTKGSLL